MTLSPHCARQKAPRKVVSRPWSTASIIPRGRILKSNVPRALTRPSTGEHVGLFSAANTSQAASSGVRRSTLGLSSIKQGRKRQYSRCHSPKDCMPWTRWVTTPNINSCRLIPGMHYLRNRFNKTYIHPVPRVRWATNIWSACRHRHHRLLFLECMYVGKSGVKILILGSL